MEFIEFLSLFPTKCRLESSDTFVLMGTVAVQQWLSRDPTLHHAAAVRGQSVEGIAHVRHILGAPQPLCHSTSARPESGRQVGAIHILSPQTGFSSNHKLLLCLSSCFKV